MSNPKQRDVIQPGGGGHVRLGVSVTALASIGLVVVAALVVLVEIVARAIPPCAGRVVVVRDDQFETGSESEAPWPV
jgi:hypothetical protein